MERLETKRKLKSISTKQEITDIFDKVVLSERERQVMNMLYINKQQMVDIADELGVSEPTVLKDHARCLDKIGAIL